MAYRKNLSRGFFRKLIDEINMEEGTSMYFKEEITDETATVCLYTGSDKLMYRLGTGPYYGKMATEDKESYRDECYRLLSIEFTKRGIRRTLLNIAEKEKQETHES